MFPGSGELTQKTPKTSLKQVWTRLSCSYQQSVGLMFLKDVVWNLSANFGSASTLLCSGFKRSWRAAAERRVSWAEPLLETSSWSETWDWRPPSNSRRPWSSAERRSFDIQRTNSDTAAQIHRRPPPWTKEPDSLSDCSTLPAGGSSPGCLAPLWLQVVHCVWYQRMETAPLPRCNLRGLWSEACGGGSSQPRASPACLQTDSRWPPGDSCGSHCPAAPLPAPSEEARHGHQKTRGCLRWRHLSHQIHYDLTEAQLPSVHRWDPVAEDEGGRGGCWCWAARWGIHQCGTDRNVLQWVLGEHRWAQRAAGWTSQMGPWPGRSETSGPTARPWGGRSPPAGPALSAPAPCHWLAASLGTAWLPRCFFSSCPNSLHLSSPRWWTLVCGVHRCRCPHRSCSLQPWQGSLCVWLSRYDPGGCGPAGL